MKSCHQFITTLPLKKSSYQREIIRTIDKEIFIEKYNDGAKVPETEMQGRDR